MSNLTVLICDDNVKAETARQFLVGQGFVVTVEPVTAFNYDATTYDHGSAEAKANVVVVTGRK